MCVSVCVLQSFMAVQTVDLGEKWLESTILLLRAANGAEKERLQAPEAFRLASDTEAKTSTQSAESREKLPAATTKVEKIL